MARTYKVVVPDGSTINIEGPEDASDDELISIASEELGRQRPKQRFATPVVDRPRSGADHMVDPGSPAFNKKVYGADIQSGIDLKGLVRGDTARDSTIATSLPGLYLQGGTLGLSDEIMGISGAAMDAVTAPFSSKVDFNPANSYRAYRDRERKRLEYTRQDNPWTGAALELAGGITSLPAKVGGEISTLMEALKSAPRLGAATGAAAGFGYGEGANGSITGAGIGAALGAGLGVALPAAGQGVGKAIRGGFDFINPRNGLAAEAVGRAMTADGITPRQAARAYIGGQKRGVPTMLADQGENLRNLLASVGRKPGPSQQLVKRVVSERQAQQGGRVRGAIERYLGRIDNPFKVSDQLSQQASRAAKPLYEQAYSLPLTVSEDIAPLMARPSVQRALSKARSIAAEEGRDPAALGFVRTPDGTVTLPKAPSLQTYDYLKRGLDDVLEGYRDKTTGKLVLDTEGRAIENTRKALVAALDNSGDAGVAYKAARAAFAGPTGQKAALETGRSALNLSDQELERVVGRLKPGERDQFALGLRSAIGDALDRRVDGGDKIGALLGTPRKRKALAQVFGGEKNFGRFIQTMADEAQASATFKRVATGSMTAENLAADEATSDASLIADLTGSAMKGAANGGLTGAAANLVSRLGEVSKFGAGKTGERTREEIAALLGEVDPETLRKAMRKALSDQAIRRVRAANQLRTTVRGATLGSRGAGALAGYGTRPRD